MKTEAAILVETGRPLEIGTLEIPKLKEGQVLVEVAFSGACHTQILEVRGYRGPDRWLPHCLGHEGTGTVLETGASVTRVKAGDRVLLSWLKSAGIEAGGATYGWAGRTVNAGAVTTFQRHAVVSENRLTQLPASMRLDWATLLGCAAPTGMGSVLNVAQMEGGNAVAVFGVGGVGLHAIIAAHSMGCKPLIAVDVKPAKLELARSFGATHVIDASAASDVAAAIRGIAPAGVDAAIEATGVPDVMAAALACVRQQGGRAVIVGNARHGSKLVLDPGLFNQGKSLLGTWGGNSIPDRDLPSFARILFADGVGAHRILSQPYRLEDINTALAEFEAGDGRRPLISMQMA